MDNFIGLDISKSTVSVFIPKGGVEIEIANTAKGFTQLFSKLKKLYKKDYDSLVFVYEPTSSYSSTLELFCAHKQIRVFKINPKASHNFAKALSIRNKTDKVDARMLCQAGMLAREEEIHIPVINVVVEQINDLMSYYQLLVKQRVQTSNHLEKLQHKESTATLKKALEKEVHAFKQKEQHAIDEIKRLITKDSQLSLKYQSIQTIKGIGDIATIALIHLFLKYPNANQKQIISLAGLDPIERTSGTSVRGKTRISKAGNKLYRRALFMGTMVAIRFNEEMKCFYDRLKEKGKHTTVVQVAVMKKLIIIARALFQSNQGYSREIYQAHCGRVAQKTNVA
ncbi:IS110 family transposase [Sulfurospirillum cavolei]|uniref:IS110 family transposase n=1 Tax=Sulfurospirillum cavolei TaxID=366522 RepID=UPI0005A79BC6|nr:IS110 family transposase [Sulfurospirillum cavolei]